MKGLATSTFRPLSSSIQLISLINSFSLSSHPFEIKSRILFTYLVLFILSLHLNWLNLWSVHSKLLNTALRSTSSVLIKTKSKIASPFFGSVTLMRKSVGYYFQEKLRLAAVSSIYSLFNKNWKCGGLSLVALERSLFISECLEIYTTPALSK